MSSAGESPHLQTAIPEVGLRGGRTACVAFFVIWIAWSGLLGWVRANNPGLDHGDITTDSNILNAGENFDREGFWASWGVPALDTFRGADKTPDHYVTYPPGCYWLHQGLKLLGASELWQFRLIAVFWSSLAALLFFVLCARVCGAALPAAIAAIAYMLSRPFAEYADNLHYLSFSQVTLFATLIAWIGIEQARTAGVRMRWLLIGAAMFALDSFITFEHTLFVGAFGLLRVLAARRWGLLLPLTLLGLVPFGVLVFRFAINAAAMGSIADVWQVMRSKFDQRTGATRAAAWTDLVRAVLDRLGWPAARSPAGSPVAAVRVGSLAPAFLAPVAMLSIIGLATWHLEGMAPARRAAGLAAALLIGGATWLIAMREHALVHHYTVLLLLPGIAAAIGALVTFGWWQRRLQPKGAPVRLAGLVAGCVLLVAHISQIRHAPIVNIRWNLDSRVHEQNRAVELFESRFAAARPAFADTRRLYMFTHDAQLGRKLAVPFDNDVGRTHSPLAPGEAQMIMWRESARAMIEMETAGPPRFLAAPAEHLAFFFAGRQQLGAARIVLADGSRISRLWVEPTLDGSAVIVGAVIDAETGVGLNGLAMQVRVVDDAGAAIRKLTTFAHECIAVTDQAIVWAQVPRETLVRGTRCEVWFTREGKGRLALDPADLKLPEGDQVRWSADGVKLTVDAP